MKILVLISFILMFFFKTGNVLSEKSIFNVNNIEIDTENYKNNEEFLNKAFIKGFDELTKRILLKKDYNGLKKTSLIDIKELISHYQIVNSEKDLQKKTTVNLFFDRKKINNFFFIKDLTYSDLTNVQVVVLPILINDNKIYIYNNNFLYEKWNSELINTEQSDIIEYLLPVENLDTIQKINLKQNNLEDIKISEILSGYDNDNLFFLIVSTKEKEVKIFLKSEISGKKVVKNFNFRFEDKDSLFNNILKVTKNEIEDIIKTQNIIDVRTPTFLNINLRIINRNDLFKLQNIFDEIDIVDNYYVREFNNDYAKIKIKFYGKLDNFYNKLKKMGAEIKITDNSWSVSLI